VPEVEVLVVGAPEEGSSEKASVRKAQELEHRVWVALVQVKERRELTKMALQSAKASQGGGE
jgi:hypothetical protein